MKRIFQLALGAIVIAACVSCTEQKTQADSIDPNAPAAKAPAPAPLPPKPPVIVKTHIPEGTKLHVALINGVSTDNSSPGDQFTATLVEPVVIDGKTVLDKGMKVRGRITDVNESGRVKGLASIRLVLTDLEVGGKDLPISTRTWSAVAQNTKKRDAEEVGGGAGLGAIIGAIAGGKKGAAVGAAVGGGVGTGAVLATKGKELHYPPETRLTFTLASAVDK